MSMKEYPAKLTTGYYRVREDREDEASQGQNRQAVINREGR